jgi:hypothetical protein
MPAPSHNRTPRDCADRSRQLVEQGLGVLEIGGVEAFGEPSTFVKSRWLSEGKPRPETGRCYRAYRSSLPATYVARHPSSARRCRVPARLPARVRPGRRKAG